MPTGPPHNPLRWLALIPLHEAKMPPTEQVTAWHAERYPEAPALVASTSAERLLTFTSGTRTLAATLVPQPIPWSQLEGPCATAWYWPNAAEKLRPHDSHLIVVLVDEPGRSIEHAMILTRMVAAMAACSASDGVFWGPGRLVHPVDAFLAQASRLAHNDLPLFLWIDFRAEKLSDQADPRVQPAHGGVRLYTTGLEALGALELEVARFAGEPQQLLEYVYNIAHYQMQKNKPIGEGDTLSVTDELQVTAHRERSMLGSDMEVIRLEFEP